MYDCTEIRQNNLDPEERELIFGKKYNLIWVVQVLQKDKWYFISFTHKML